MTNLIDKLQAAERGGRELDYEIHALVLGGKFKCDKDGRWLVVIDGMQYAVTNTSTPHYTASVDAALTLVNEGADWDLGYIHLNGGCSAYVKSRSAKAPTPALALCIAALMARDDD